MIVPEIFHSYESVASMVPLAATIILTGMVCIRCWFSYFSSFINNHFTWLYFDAAINPPIAAIGPSILTSAAANLGVGVLNPAVPGYQAFDLRLSNPMVMS